MKDNRFRSGVADLLKFYKGSGKILDIGCGADKCIPQAIGVDCDPRVKPDLCCDIEKGFPFKENEINYIMGLDVVEHMRYVDKFFDELYRILEPGGVVAFMIPDSRYVPLTEKFNLNPDHKHWWKPADFIGEVNLEKWRIKQFDTVRNFWWFDIILQKP